MPNNLTGHVLMSHDDLKELDIVLSKGSYVNGGFAPTSDDFDTLIRIREDSIKDLSNVTRWYNHLRTFTKEEKRACPNSPKTHSKKDLPKDETYDKSLISDAAKANHESKQEVEVEDDFDLFGEETAEEKAVKEAITKIDYSKAKAAKVVVGKSSLVFDVIPNESEEKCNYEVFFKALSAIVMDGVVWGEKFKVVPMCYGLQKIQMVATILDEVDTELLIEKMLVVGCDEQKAKRRIQLIQLGEDEDDEEQYYVSSCEIISFQKL